MQGWSLAQLAVVSLSSAFVALAVILPSWRMKRLAGTTGYVAHMAASPIQRLAVTALKCVTVSYGIWIGLVVFIPAEKLGVWGTPDWVAWLGIALAVIGLALIVVAQAAMGRSWRIGIDPHTRTKLVTSGPFQIVRNPIFSGVLLFGGAVFLLTPSAWSLMGWCFLAFTLAVQVRIEEEHLLRSLDGEYASYASRVGRFFPSVGRLSS